MSDSAQDRGAAASRNPSGRRSCSTASTSMSSTGECLVVIGGSGTGKSVTHQMHPRHAAPGCRHDHDRRRGGRPICSGAAREALMQKFGMLFQGAALFDSLPVWENVAFGLIQGRGMARAQGAGHRDREARHGRAWAPKSASSVAGRTVGRHAEARGAGPRHRRRSRDHLLRRADHRARPDHGRRHQRPDRQMRAGSRRHRALDHPRHGERAQDRRPHRHDLQGKIIWDGPTGEIDHTGNPYVDQFIHGRAEGPIKMEVRAL